MFNALASAGSFIAPYVPGMNTLRKQQLMENLAKYVEQDYAGAIEKLLENQQDVALIVAGLKESAYSPLHQAAAQGRNRALLAMLKNLPLEVWALRTPDSGRTPLMLAAENGSNDEISVKLFCQLSDYVWDCENRMPSQIGRDAINALKVAFNCELEREDFQSIWRNIVNARDHEGNTPLLLAVQKNHVACSTMLLGVKADHTITNNRGDNALNLALAMPKNSEMHQLFAPSRGCAIL